MKKHLLLLVFSLMPYLALYAQLKREWEQYLFDLSTIENMESSSWQSYYDLLYDLEENPMNINAASREDLEQLPFLSAQDVESIQEYIYKYGPFKTLGELVLLENIDYNKRKLLFYFTYAGEVREKHYPEFSNILKYGKYTVLASGKVPFYTRKGDREKYLGYKYKHSIRYDYSYSDYMRWGIVGAQDAGEPFFAGKNACGYDYYSFYFLIRNCGRLKSLAIGKYKLKFGLGLVMNNSLNFGKLSTLSSMNSMSNNIRPHTSSMDVNSLQGAAATVNLLKGLDVSAFVSYGKIDGTLDADGNVSSIVTSDYHRTPLELSKKNNTSQFVTGGNINFKCKGFHIGGTIVYTNFNRNLTPNKSATYRKYYAEGKDFFNASINYGYICHKLSFSGETAVDKDRNIATLHTLDYRVNERMDLFAVHRFYDYRYNALFSEAFSDGGTVKNESGAYIGMNYKLRKHLLLSAYADFSYFAWPKYQISVASHSIDNFLKIVYTPQHYVLSAQYRLKLRQADNEDKTDLISKIEHRARVSIALQLDSMLTTKTQLDAAYCSYKSNSKGWMLSQSVSCQWLPTVNVGASLSYFDTDDYNSRLYHYERGLLYAFSSPSFYGQGIRASLITNCSKIRNILIIGKLGVSKYFDRHVIGSSYQQINHSSATDLELQLRWKF